MRGSTLRRDRQEGSRVEHREREVRGREEDASMGLQPHCRSIRGGDGATQWTQSLAAEMR